jgi:hypothetical protein
MRRLLGHRPAQAIAADGISVADDMNMYTRSDTRLWRTPFGLPQGLGLPPPLMKRPNASRSFENRKKEHLK